MVRCTGAQAGVRGPAGLGLTGRRTPAYARPAPPFRVGNTWAVQGESLNDDSRAGQADVGSIEGDGARSIVGLVTAGAIDPPRAALVWLLAEHRVPLVVAGGPDARARGRVLAALLDLLPPDVRLVRLAGPGEDFAWLPEAAALGWRSDESGPGERRSDRPDPASPEDTVLLAGELDPDDPAGTWGDRARIALRAPALGYGLVATSPAPSLQQLLAGLTAPPVGLTEDELSRLGVVVVLGPDAGDLRVTAAHFVRPLARDAGGHVQRLGPAVLATWDAARGAFEDFSWAIAGELAERVGWSAREFEAERAHRSAFLRQLVAAGIVEVADVRSAIGGYRAVHAPARRT